MTAIRPFDAIDIQLFRSPSEIARAYDKYMRETQPLRDRMAKLTAMRFPEKIIFRPGEPAEYIYKPWPEFDQAMAEFNELLILVAQRHGFHVCALPVKP